MGRLEDCLARALKAKALDQADVDFVSKKSQELLEILPRPAAERAALKFMVDDAVAELGKIHAQVGSGSQQGATGNTQTAGSAQNPVAGNVAQLQGMDPEKPLPLGDARSIMEEIAEATDRMPVIGSLKRGLMDAGIGTEQTVNRYAYHPIVKGLRQAIDYIAPDSGAAKFAQHIDDAFAKHLEEGTEQREQLGAESTKEGFAGEVAHATGQLAGDLPSILLTGGLLPELKAGAALINTLRTGAASMTMPALRAGADAINQVAEQGGGEAEQFFAGIKATGEAMALGAIPMAVESKAGSVLGRVAERTAKAVPVASASAEAGRLADNLLPGEDQPFSLRENIKSTIPLALLGGVAGRDARADRIMAKEAAPAKAPAPEAAPEATGWQPSLAFGIVANPKAAQGFAALGGRGDTPSVPKRPTIEPVYRDPLRIEEGAADVLEKSGLPELGGKVRDYVDEKRRMSGQYDNPFRVWSKGASKENIVAAEREFSRYWESVEQNGLEKSKPIYDAASPKVKEVIDIWKKTSHDMIREAQASGVKVKDGEHWRPIRDLGEGFFPRRIKPEWLKVLRNPHKHPRRYDEIRREMIEKGFAKDAETADKYVERVIEEYDDPSHKVSSIERARSSKLPTKVYDYSFETARNYISAFSKDVAGFKAFGQSLGGRHDTAFDRAQKATSDDYSKHYIKKLKDVIYQEHDPWAKPAQIARSISVLSFLGNIRSSIRNLASGAMFNVQNYGLRDGLDSVGKAFKEIDSAYEKGILHDDLANMMTADVSDIGRTLNKATNTVLKWNRYKAVEEYTRAMSLVGARAKLRTAIRDAGKDPTSRRALNNAGYFKRLGVDPQKLLDENGEGPLTDRYLRSSVADIQGGYDVDQTPIFANTEAGKTLFHLQKWGTQALRHFDRNVINPALQTIKAGRKETVNLRDKNGNIVESRVPGSIRPLARYLLLLPAVGMAQQQAEEWIFGIPDREASMAEILMRMDDDAAEAMGMLAHKLYAASLNVGLLGTIGGIAKTMEVAGLQNVAIPPPLQIVTNAKDLILKAYDQGFITANDIKDVVTKQFTGAKVLGQMASQVPVLRDMSPTLQMVSKKQDLTWLRAVEQRYADDLGVSARAPMRGQFGSSPMAPFYQGIEDKILLGDVAGARKLMDEQFAGLTASQKKIAMQGLQKSVLANRPIKIAGSQKEEIRASFLQWADKNLPPEDVLRIKEIDETYRETATRLGLFKPKKLGSLEKEMEEFITRSKLRAGELGD